MDSFISIAIEEICAEGPMGMPLEKIWSVLLDPMEAFGLQMDDAVKETIWWRLLTLPDLTFNSSASSLSREDVIISVDQAEQMGMKIAAGESLRDSFLGISDLKASNVEITPVLQRILERIAVSRANGVAQSQLSKELKMKENTLFYFLKKLESQALIVRQSTILRTKEGNSAKQPPVIVYTNMVYLSRYAKRLSSFQRVEIKTPNLSSLDHDVENLEGRFGEESAKEDVSVKDYLPEMSAICGMLEASAEKVLVVSDIKVARGYRMTLGHRSWRNICNRMKEACLVEEIMGKVNGKVVKCLRLLKKFDPKDFLPKVGTCGYECSSSDPPEMCSRRSQITEQFVELPLENRIYDMINAEGSKGIIIPEISKKLGIGSKKIEARICDMCWRMPKRFPMHMRFENFNRTKVYRVWTLQNFQENSSAEAPINDGKDLVITDVSKNPNDSVGRNLPVEQSLSDEVDCALINSLLPCSVKDMSVTSAAEKALECDSRDANVLPSIPKIQSCRKYSSEITVESAQREKRIIGRLKNEKFILTAELHRWLDDLEKDKKTTMARKTLTRLLQKLQREGYCKCVQISVPVLTNCSRNRSAEVIFHPSVENISSELLGQIHQRLREFNMQSRGQRLDRPTNGEKVVSELSNLRKSPDNFDTTDSPSVKLENMRINGFVPAIMVRAKLLHTFLWNYVYDMDTNDEVDDFASSCSMLRSFSLGSAIENMRFELFVQVAGSDKCFPDLVEKCKLGLRLCDLPAHEFKNVVDTHATGRLSRVVDILYRLKLIQLATEGLIADKKKTPLCLSTYSLELKPSIEEPRNSTSDVFFSKQKRHEFLLTNREAVDSYWQTLEYCHVSGNQNSSTKTFPASAVKELFNARAWTSVRVMSAEQHKMLLERLGAFAPKKKTPFVECVKICKELDVTLEQVLRVASDVRRGHCLKLPKNSNGSILEEQDKDTMKSASSSRKRKKLEKIENSNADEDNDEIEERSLSKRSKMGSDLDNSGKKSETCSGKSRMDCVESSERSSRLPILLRKKKFHWSQDLDRRLIIKYVEYRAPFGAKFFRVDWTSVSDLPADPDMCKRRMNYLNCERTIRKKVMKLCNVVSSRYARFLKESKMARESHHEDPEMIKWDDFDVPEVQKALDEVLHFRNMAKLGYNRIKPRFKKIKMATTVQDLEPSAGITSEECTTTGSDVHKLLSSHGFSGQGDKHLHDSLSLSNAVELFKLIFLSTSMVPEVKSLLAETLKWYSEADLTMAFNYLKKMKLAEHAQGNHQVVLSQGFFNRSYASPFPVDTGKRAEKLLDWLRDEDRKLNHSELNLEMDLQCGEIFQLLPLISSGSFSIHPRLPEEGIGEAEELNHSIADAFESAESDEKITARQKFWWRKDSEPCYRREKGFPGIKLLLKRKELATAEIFVSEPKRICPGERREFTDEKSFLGSFCSKQTVDTRNISLEESVWESMGVYASKLNSGEGLVSPGLLKDVYSAVLQSGEEGLLKEELSERILMLDNKLVEVIVDTLTEFQLVAMVNGYDHVRIVDASYKSKYFIAVLDDIGHNSAPKTTQGKKDEISPTVQNPEDAWVSDDMTGFNLLSNIREDSKESCSKEKSDAIKGKVLAPVKESRCQAIFPWINGDGSTNDVVYNGFVRRILGIVMQNPGILEEEIMDKMVVLNPQSCRQLLDLMLLDNHIIVKKMLQVTGCGPPSILGDLFSPARKTAEATVFRKHYFANPMSASLL